MKFVLNKQTGIFILREDLTSGIKAAARDLADLEGKKLKTIQDVTRAVDNEYNKAKKTKEQKKTEYEEAKDRLEKQRSFLLSYRDKKVGERKYSEDPKTKAVALYLEGNSKDKPNEAQIDNYIKELSIKSRINDPAKLEQIKKDIITYVNYSEEQETIDPNKLEEAREIIRINVLGGKILAFALGQQELMPFIGYLYDLLCLEPQDEINNKFAKETLDFTGLKNDVNAAIGAVRFFLSVKGIQTILINLTPLGGIEIIKALYTVIKHRKECPDDEGQDQLQDEQTSDLQFEDDGPIFINTGTGQNIVNESKILKEYREDIHTLLIPHMQKQLGFSNIPNINFIEDQENAKDMVGRTAYYDPNTTDITVYVTNRHPKDIMRSVAHEVIHHAQNERGEFDNLGEMGEGYFQTNPHLHKLEIEAYSSGNDLFRKWEENFRKQRNQNTMVNENNLRAKIRSLIETEMKNMANEVKKHDADCDCLECKVKKYKKPNKQDLAESVDREVMPLKEWRNMELNSLLLNRFGIVSPHVLGEKKEEGGEPKTAKQKELAAKTPPKDKITRGDVITAAKEKSKGKSPVKKGKVPPQFLKDKKKDESK